MRAFSLAEAILALGLCTIVLLLVIALAVSANRTQRKSGAVLLAHSYAGQVLERFVYDLPAAGSSFWSQTSFSNPYRQDQSQIGPVLYESKLYLQSLTSLPNGLLSCTVNVSWSAGTQQGAQSISVSRLVYAP